MKRTVFATILFLLPLLAVLAQQQPAVPVPGTPGFGELLVGDEERLFLAISSSEYPVTPGDVYQLTFQQANVPVTMVIIAESSLTVSLNVFGDIDASGMTFPALKREVEKRVAEAYPRSAPSFVIVGTGIFRVLVKGEVPESFFYTAWGLSRLSDAVDGRLGAYSSTRDIEIIGADGRRRSYDLFRARRFGDLNEDPYLTPGDTIVVNRRDRQITLSGEVLRPGRYQLLPEDGLQALIEEYGGGFTERAQASRVKIHRISDNTEIALIADATGRFYTGPPLRDSDEVVVNQKTIGKPVVFFEGAVLTPQEEQLPAADDDEAGFSTADITYGRITHEFRSGESLSDALRSVLDRISPLASLSEAYIVREGAQTPVIEANLEELLFMYDPAADIPLEPYDRIVIPGKHYFITVTGAVQNPGAYPYTPDQRYGYYLNLAGGMDPGPDSPNLIITGYDGSERGAERTIQPNDNIHLAQMQVTVTGAVVSPGIYEHVPNRKWNYYVNMAGGFAAGGLSETIEITDIRGDRKERDAEIDPDDNIFVVPAQVVISGSVVNPGVYPFRPKRTWQYYVSIAGGMASGGSKDRVTVTTAEGEVRDPGDFVEPDDNIQVDLAQVTVSGAVFTPGSVPYSPGKTYQYYIGLAGGFDQERNRSGDVSISDADGKAKWEDEIIQPGDRIYALNNSFLYNFNTYFPVVTSGVVFITTIINLIDLLSR